MEGGRTEGDGGGVAGAAAAGQERRRRWRGAGCGDEEDSSHGSSGGAGVELSLRLRTGAADDNEGAGSAPPRAVAAAAAQAEARRNMTIFYNGRVCAVDVTEVQARAIISMASEETLAAADHRRQQLMRGDDDDCRRRRLHDGDSSSSSTSAVARRGALIDRGLARPALASLAAAGVVGSPRQGGFPGGAAAAPVVQIDPAAAATGGLSMKRSLQLFLQKRKARTAAAVARPYAGGGHRQAQAVRR